ncbi:MAG TPA: ABC transporter permease [Desulfobacteraceae bacterium]|nr:ABC transporter permease [Desulfobacteraceae bacterium]HPQ28500.1 ABC transporter permease [Desulfobacteraceae bacterium]
MNQPEIDTRKPHIHIKPKKGWQVIDLGELRQYRDLFYFLVIRDIRVKYKQTVLGGLWAIIQPFFAMVVFTLFFGKLAKIPSDGIPYPIFNYTAMVAWTYFSTSITGSANSLVSNTNLISKVYFPRIVVPLSPVLAGLLDFFIAFIVLIGMMFYFHVYPNTMIVFLPILVLMMVLTSSGIGMVLAALNAKYRDIKFTIPFLIQLWMFASPIVYPVSMIPEKYRLLYALNPMTGIIEGFRAILLGTVAFPGKMILISAILSIVIFLFGLFYFKQMERYFADII